MRKDGYKKSGRIFEDMEPNTLLCPQCNDWLICTDDRSEAYCFGCDVVWKRHEVLEMIPYGAEEPVKFVERDGE